MTVHMWTGGREWPLHVRLTLKRPGRDGQMRSLTQLEMSKAVGLSGDSWRRYEAGDRAMPGSVQVLVRLLLRLQKHKAELEAIADDVTGWVWRGPNVRLPDRIRAAADKLSGDDT